MKKKGKRKYMTILKRVGGISLACLLMAFMSMLATAPAGAQLESQCRIVSPGTCAECHPKKDEGKCNLVDDHKERARCAECHADCVDNAPPPEFDHFEDICFECHNLEKVHKKHDEKSKADVDCTQCHSGKKILIVADSKHGSTGAYADILGEALCAEGFLVDNGRAHKMQEFDISGYDGVVLGSPTYWGFPLQDLRKFLENNAAELDGKPTAYMYNSLEGAETGNSDPKAFLQFAYHPVLRLYPDLFPIDGFLQNQVPPNGECDLTVSPFTGMPAYTNCDVPAWVGLMPGNWIPRNGFPVEYMPLELFGFGGFKPFFREAAAVEYAQTLVDINFFDGACGPDNISPTVTADAFPTSGTEPLEVTFTATASDTDGTVESYSWTFGDGSTSDQENPVHTYSCAGTYTARVKVTDNNCGIAVSTVTINVGSSGIPISFDCNVAPILEQFCNDCHGTGGGLNTSTCEGLEQGGNSGPAIIPGSKELSLLYQTITGGAPAMPPSGTTVVPLADIDTIGAWIDSLSPSCLPDEICTCPIIIP
jgi:hypothetical protein